MHIERAQPDEESRAAPCRLGNKSRAITCVLRARQTSGESSLWKRRRLPGCPAGEWLAGEGGGAVKATLCELLDQLIITGPKLKAETKITEAVSYNS